MNLDTPIKKALTGLAQDKGNLDQFVADALQMPRDELQEAFYAEQVDAIALAIDSLAAGEGFVLGDMTGVGKGRVLAGLIRYSILQNITPIFLTEKPNLFENIIGDLEDIGSGGLVNPLILNDGVMVRNEFGEIIMRSTPRPILNEVMESGNLGEFNCVFGTYSQVNRRAKKDTTGKVAFLQSIARGNNLILDESHNASGDSSTGHNIMAALDVAHSVLYSSATWAKRPDTMKIYHRTALGSIVRSHRFAEIMHRGGEPLQEIMSAMLAESGQYIRREHDFSRARFERAVANEYSDEHRRIADQVSGVFAMIAALSGEVSAQVEKDNEGVRATIEALRDRLAEEDIRIAERMGVTHTRFTSKLWNLNNVFLMTLKSGFSAEQAIRSLEAGEKPIITVSSTLESHLQALLRYELDLRIDDGELEPGSTIKALAGTEIDYGFREVIRRTVDSVLRLRRVDRHGVVTYNDHIDASLEELRARSPEELTAHERMYVEINDRIDALPDLPLSPVDKVMAEIRAAGYSIAEITGRTMGIDYSNPRRPKIYFYPTSNKKNRNRVIHAFNNGTATEGGERELLDALVINRAAAAGISLHAGSRFQDLRPRHMMIQQPELDVNNYMQLLGRIFRADMVNNPRYTMMLADLPAEVRPAAMLNRKLAGLSANTTSNRDSNARLESPDMYNWVGDEVALEALMHDPETCNLLQFNIAAEMGRAEVNKSTGLMERLTGRMTLLPVEAQEHLYDLFELRFNEKIEKFEAQGFNPFRTREFDLRATEIGRYLLDGYEETDNVFDSAVYVSEIEYEREIKVASFDVASNALDTVSAKTQRVIPGPLPFDTLWPQMRRAIDNRLDLMLKSQKKFESLEAALEDEESNIFKILHGNKTAVDSFRSKLTYGTALEMPAPGSEKPIHAYFLGVDLPESGHYELFGKYVVRLVSPEPEGGFLRMTLHAFCEYVSEGKLKVLSRQPSLKEAKALFDNQPAGVVKERRLVLTGNLLKAVEYAQTHKRGIAAVYTSDSGERIRGVIMPLNVTKERLLTAQIALESGEMVKDYMTERKARAKILTAPMRGDAKAVLQRRKDTEWGLAIPSSKRDGEPIYSNPRIKELIPKFTSRKGQLVAVIRDENVLTEVLDVMARELGIRFQTAESDFKAIEWGQQWRRAKQEAEHVAEDVPSRAAH